MAGVALFGFWAGFFYGFATRLPTGADTLDTFAERTDAPGGRNWIAVRGPEEVRRDALGILDGLQPDKLVPSVSNAAAALVERRSRGPPRFRSVQVGPRFADHHVAPQCGRTGRVGQ